jgi:Na+/melibiose symporter-like transporter
MSFVLEFYARPNSVSAQTSSGVIFVRKSHNLVFSPISGYEVDAIDMFE